jgi:hypothetical protein
VVTSLSKSETGVPALLAELKSTITGDLYIPGDDGYEQAWMGWNLSVHQHPAVIVVVRNVNDVTEVVRYASAAGLGVAVQSTGHGVIVPANDNLLIVTSQLDDVQVDAGAQTAHVGAGASWGAVLEATQVHGLAPLLGSSPTVGVVGYSLGGGLGWLARKYGLACDRVHAIELVTADGRFIRASAEENSDLYWAMRGGGGGFGVVTALEFGLVPVSTVYGGTLLYPVELAEEVFKSYRAWTMALSEEWTTSVKLANFPPVDLVPEMLRGKSFVMINGCYCGPAEEGEVYLKDWLDWGAHIQNSFRVMPFGEVASISQDPQDPVPSMHNGAWLNQLNEDVIKTIIQYATPQDGPTPLTITEVRHVGGAMSRVDSDANAFGLRDSKLLMEIVGFTPTPELHAAVKEHNGRFKSALAPHLADGIYMNFLEGEEARRRTHQAFSAAKYERLTDIKTKYDPQNLFRFGYDISPK